MKNRTPAFIENRMRIKEIMKNDSMSRFRKIEQLNRMAIICMDCGAKILESRILMRMCHDNIHTIFDEILFSRDARREMFEKKNQEQQ